MRTSLSLLTIAVVLGWVSGAALSSPAAPAAPAAAEPMDGQVTLSWEQFVKITGYDPAKRPAGMLSIPWEEVQKLLPDVKLPKIKEGTMLELPWNEFKALLEWSIQRAAPKPEEAPPTDYVVTSSRYSGTLSADAAEMTLELKLNILRKKTWKRIPILPIAVALKTTELGGPDVFLSAGGNAYELLTTRDGEVAVKVTFAVAVQKSGGVNQVSFPRMLGGSSIVDVKIARPAGAAEKVDVTVAGAQSTVVKPVADGTQVAAAIPGAAPVVISWQRALPEVPPVPAKLYAETATLVSIAEGVLLCQEVINFNVLHSAVRELTGQVPAGASVLTVGGPGVRDWRVDKDGRLLVVLGSEMIGAVSLRVAYELPTPRAGEVSLPVIRAGGVEREKGFVGVVALTNVEVTGGAATGATAVDVRQLPPEISAMTNQPILLGYRYLGEKFAMPISIRRHAEVEVLVTVVDSALLTGMQLPDGRRMTKAVYSVRNNRSQFLRLRMPGGEGAAAARPEIWSVAVGGNTVAPARDEAGNILVPLIRSDSRSSELRSFPVEVVYVEAPEKTAAERGTMHVDLPTCEEVPVLHVMYKYYVPAEGKYTVGWGASGFSGPMEVVKEFASLSAAAGGAIARIDAPAAVAAMQKQLDQRADEQARAAGATPIRVSLPIHGKLFLLEKILALPKDRLWFEVRYSGWKVAK